MLYAANGNDMRLKVVWATNRNKFVTRAPRGHRSQRFDHALEVQVQAAIGNCCRAVRSVNSNLWCLPAHAPSAFAGDLRAECFAAGEGVGKEASSRGDWKAAPAGKSGPRKPGPKARTAALGSFRLVKPALPELFIQCTP
uniref:Uncharacterized protein n=1 Tax=Trichuris muris TaxID=70415 RepID=A0A5S6Q8W4_TRIMR